MSNPTKETILIRLNPAPKPGVAEYIHLVNGVIVAKFPGTLSFDWIKGFSAGRGADLVNIADQQPLTYMERNAV